MSELPPSERALLVYAERRLGWWILLLLPPGTVVSGWRWGWAMGLAFALGGLLAYLNYRWIVAVVDTLFRALETESRIPRRTYLKILAPLVLLGFLFYATVRSSLLPLAGVFAGLLLIVAAVVVEATVQILFGVKS